MRTYVLLLPGGLLACLLVLPLSFFLFLLEPFFKSLRLAKLSPPFVGRLELELLLLPSQGGFPACSFFLLQPVRLRLCACANRWDVCPLVGFVLLCGIEEVIQLRRALCHQAFADRAGGGATAKQL